MPCWKQLLKKMSPNVDPIRTRKPSAPIAIGAVSRELPHPKFGPVSMICAPASAGSLSGNDGSGLPVSPSPSV